MGEIKITEEVVEYNAMEASVFELFRIEMRRFTQSKKAGWYAYIHEDGVYTFKWVDHEDAEKISTSYLELLKRDGWNVAMNAAVIEDAFK